MSTLLSLVVVETESGAEVRVRDSEEAGEAYLTLRAALDSLLTDGEFAPKKGILRDEAGEAIGAWRWLDATAEEPVALEDGTQVTRELIARMASGLNAGSPAPIDGGTTPAHAQAFDGTTRADGYAHVGAEVRDRSGRWHLYLYVELAPAVARDTDAGVLAYGSVAFTMGGRLIQHALTNTPAVEGLAPNNAIRGPRGLRIFYRSMRVSMPNDTTKPALRGPAKEALAKVAALLGLTVDEVMEQEGYGSKLADKIYELERAAKGEDVIETVNGGGGSPDGAPPPAQASAPAAPATATNGAATAQRTDAPPAAAPPVEQRADAFADAAAMEAFASTVLGSLRDVFGKPEAAPAELLEMLTASIAAFKGALGTAAPPDNASDTAAMTEAAPAARALAAEVPALRTELARLKAEVVKRDLRDAITKRSLDARVSLTSADLDQLVSDALAVADDQARERLIGTALRAAQAVPTGEVFSRSVNAGGGHDSFRSAWRSLLPEVERDHPNLPRQHRVALAQRAARERFPHLADA